MEWNEGKLKWEKKRFKFLIPLQMAKLTETNKKLKKKNCEAWKCETEERKIL